LGRIVRAVDINLPEDAVKARTIAYQRFEEVRTVAGRALQAMGVSEPPGSSSEPQPRSCDPVIPSSRPSPTTEGERGAGSEVKRLRDAISDALETLNATDRELGEGGVARRAYADLYHALFADPLCVHPSFVGTLDPTRVACAGCGWEFPFFPAAPVRDEALGLAVDRLLEAHWYTPSDRSVREALAALRKARAASRVQGSDEETRS
jgi:hypothetical protein